MQKDELSLKVFNPKAITTVLALDLAKQMQDKGYKVLFLTLELDKNDGRANPN